MQSKVYVIIIHKLVHHYEIEAGCAFLVYFFTIQYCI